MMMVVLLSNIRSSGTPCCFIIYFDVRRRANKYKQPVTNGIVSYTSYLLSLLSACLVVLFLRANTIGHENKHRRPRN